MTEQQAIESLKACQPLAIRLMEEGSHLSIESLTQEDRVSLENLEDILAYHAYEERIKLSEQAGISEEALARLERFYNRLRLEGNPQGAATTMEVEAELKLEHPN